MLRLIIPDSSGHTGLVERPADLAGNAPDPDGLSYATPAEIEAKFNELLAGGSMIAVGPDVDGSEQVHNWDEFVQAHGANPEAKGIVIPPLVGG